ncbi:MAG: Cdc6/Cdc18 family protein [Candidatus Woesearchaeota archaeon]
MGYRFTQNKKTEDLFKIVSDIVNKKSAVFVLDEVDKSEEIDVIYTLIEQIYRKTIIMITNFKSWIDNLDIRVQSRLTPEFIEFKPYNASETKGILENRMKYAFQPGAWKNDAFNKVIEKTAALEDIRSGLYLMKEAGNAAEDRASRFIEVKDVESAIKKLDEFSIKNSSDLDSESKKILEIARNNSGMKIGDMFKIYEKSGGEMTYKTFQRKIEKLSKSKFIVTEKISGGKDGKTTIINTPQKALDEF